MDPEEPGPGRIVHARAGGRHGPHQQGPPARGQGRVRLPQEPGPRAGGAAHDEAALRGGAGRLHRQSLPAGRGAAQAAGQADQTARLPRIHLSGRVAQGAAREGQLHAMSAVQIGVDIGGTFTDIVALDRMGRLALTKVPSTPKDLLDGIGAAVTRVLALAGGQPGDVERFIHGTTIATNAILEQKGAVTAVLTTDGFEDVLELGRMKRSRMYDLAMDPEVPTFLAPRRRRLGIRERLDARGRVLAPLDESGVRAAGTPLAARGVHAVAVSY